MNLENRIEKLESRTQQENAPCIFICSITPRQSIDGYELADGNTFWRLHGESDDDLIARIEKALKPESGTLVMLKAVERQKNYVDE